jgi:hypothetical protein
MELQETRMFSIAGRFHGIQAFKVKCKIFVSLKVFAQRQDPVLATLYL